MKNDEGVEIGVTPFFYEFPKDSDHELSFNGEKAHYDCSWNWGGSLVPNNIWLVSMSGVGAAVSVSFDLIDFISGGLFNCDDEFRVKVKVKKSELTAKEKRVLILPPMDKDEVVSDRIAQYIEEKYPLKKGQYLSLKETKNFLHVNRVNNFSINRPDSLNGKSLRKIGHKFNITHFLYIDVEKNKSDLTLTPVLYDAFNLKKKKTLKKRKITINRDKGNTVLGYLVDAISLLPNAVTVGYMPNPGVSYGSRSSPEQGGSSLDSNPHPDAFPKIFSAFGIETVHHSMFFDSWDYDFYLAPSFNTSAWQSSYSDYSINVQSYNAMFGGYVVGQSPFGQLSMGFSLGLLYLSAEDSLGKSTQRGTLGTKLSIDYKYFMGERWYFTFGAYQFGLDEQTLNYDQYHLTDWQTAFVGLGYYFPEFRSLVRRIF